MTTTTRAEAPATSPATAAQKAALVGGRAPIRITAASECRQDLYILIVDESHWSLFDLSAVAPEWLGDIVRDQDRYFVNHEQGAKGYEFDAFSQALTYFMEYGFALSHGRALDRSERRRSASHR